MSRPILDIRHLSVEFPANRGIVRAVQDISFHLMAGETLAVVGESGSGKSVTALAIMGLLPPSARIQGVAYFHPESPSMAAIDLFGLSAAERRTYRGGVMSMIFQEPMTSLNPVFTCGSQVVEAIRLHNQVNREEAEKQAIALFQEVKLPDPAGLFSRYPHELSGGQLQRVMIAMALSGNPSILIADEPTTALDVTIQATILQLLQEIRDRRHMAVLFITHDMGVVSQIADRVVVMYRGQVVETAPVYDLFAHPQHPYTQGLLNCRPRPDRHLRRLPTVADFMRITPTATGDFEVVPQANELDIDPRFTEISIEERDAHAHTLTQQAPLLTVQNLVKTFPVRRGWWGRSTALRVVDGVSFEVYPGETLGLVGESGCGKSTLSRVLLRLIEPTSGQVWFDGQSVFGMDPANLRRLRREMQIVFQNPFGSMDARQSIGSALMEPMLIHNIGPSAQNRQQRAIALLERVGLGADALYRFPHEFSGGQRQRICIARTLACEPRFIICDESVSALDVSVQAQVLNLLKDLQQDFGLTYIFISHDLSVVKFISDRIMVMNQGRIEEIGPAESIYRTPRQDYTQQLIQAIPHATLEDMYTRQQAHQGKGR